MSRNFFFVSVLVLLALAVSVTSANAGSPMGTSFAFQGKIRSTYTGYCDMTFSLWDASSGGSQVGTTIARNRQLLTSGAFSTALDFGPGAILREERWVEVRARCPSSLTGLFINYGRTKLEAVPYALVALDATNALDADLLDGAHGSYYLNAGNINAGSLGTGYYSAYSDLDAEGYLANAPGDLALNNGSLQASLNTDLLDGFHAGNSSGLIPISNGSRNFDLNADIFDGQHGSFYLNASNITTGTLGSSFYSAIEDLSAEGWLTNEYNSLARNNGILQSSLNADQFEGWHGSYYLDASHTNAGMLGSDFFSAHDDLGNEGYLDNGTGDLAQNNTILQVTLNADLLDGVSNGYVSADVLDGFHAGNSSGQIPLSNDTLNTNLNADLLDGQDGSYYQNASHLNAGTVNNNYFSAYSDLGAEGYLGNAANDVAFNNGVPQATLNADLLDGAHAGAFSPADHNHDAAYVNEGQADSITSGMIVNGAVVFADWASNGCSSGQIPQWNGSAWICANNSADADTLDGQHASTFWQVGGNAVGLDSIIGTLDDYSLDIRVNNSRILRLEPNATSPNIIGGYSGNWITAGVSGAFIGGGGTSGVNNRVTDDCWRRHQHPGGG
jgi:hypothetical protein